MPPKRFDSFLPLHLLDEFPVLVSQSLIEYLGKWHAERMKIFPTFTVAVEVFYAEESRSTLGPKWIEDKEEHPHLRNIKHNLQRGEEQLKRYFKCQQNNIL